MRAESAGFFFRALLSQRPMGASLSLSLYPDELEEGCLKDISCACKVFKVPATR